MSRLSLVLALLLTACGHSKHAVSLYEAGDYAGASRAADEGLAKHPDDGGLWAMKVRAALALGDADAVAKAYAALVEHTGADDKDLLRDLATATLGQGLASPSAKLKIAAINAIEDLELQALADDVFQTMNDEDDRVAASAAIAVIHGYPQAPQVADDMLKSENPEARRIAVEGVAKKIGKIALADIEKAATDPDAHVRRAAIYWLGALKDPDAVEVCTRHLKDPDETVRAAAASALAKIGLGNLEDVAKHALADKALGVRLAGIELLTAAKRDDEIAALANDPDPMVAVTAAVAVAKTHPGLGGPALDRAAGSPEWTIRAGAANLAVAAVGREAALTYARRLVGDPELRVRLAAARVLAHTGDAAGARPLFMAALDSPERDQAAADLAALGDPTGLATLSADVRDAKRTPDQRAEAASAHRTAHHVTPGLVAALADPNGLVRVQAAATLGALAR
ncbi:MAG: HEAT repeat domain-containing protein [Deltaproteobacteria bacterium]|nr:HEAT repeat domain-containing protein [Deltaproteobacteria bacterium]